MEELYPDLIANWNPDMIEDLFSHECQCFGSIYQVGNDFYFNGKRVTLDELNKLRCIYNLEVETLVEG